MSSKTEPLRVCCYEDRPHAMDCLILMGESLCRADARVSLHITAPEAPSAVRAWAAGRPEVVLSDRKPEGVSGWDVKPWLLLQELNEGSPQALWLDNDIIVTRPVSGLLDEFPGESLIVAEEWARATVPVSQFWGLSPSRPIPAFNACVVRATQAHRVLLERWLELLRDPRYRHAQKLPFEQRPVPLLHDGWLLIALLESADFASVAYNCLRRGRQIAQCAGSSGYRPRDRVLDLFRGLPPLIHGLGRKPWDTSPDAGRFQRWLLDLATDVSPFVLASRRVAGTLDMHPPWLEARTMVGRVLRALTNGHPGLAGLPLAIPHALAATRRQQSNA